MKFDELKIPYAVKGRDTIRRVAEYIFNAGESGVTCDNIMSALGITRTAVERALTVLRRKCKAPIYTIGGSGNPVYVWENLVFAKLEDDNG